MLKITGVRKSWRNDKSTGVLVLGTVILVALIYDILWDITLLCVLFCSSYAIAAKISIPDNATGIFVKTAIGLGILGVVIYYLLLFGVATSSIYILLLLIPCCLNRKSIVALFSKVTKILDRKNTNLYILVCLFVFYIMYASAPIDDYDSLTKHLPLTMYAAEFGEWNTNILESLVYGESMLLQYTYSALFATFDAYKALSIFNVFLFMLIFVGMHIMVCDLAERKWNPVVNISIIFTTPLFFQFATCFYLEMLPVYFLVAAILGIQVEGHKKSSWEYLPLIAFLAGCAVFSKLTIAYSVLVVGLLCIALAILHWKQCAFEVLALVKKFLLSAICFIAPFATSLVCIWYKTGSPLFPFYNGIFRSPYFNLIDFTDPFPNKLGLTIKSLMDIVFHTSLNIEMADFGLGGFLLLLAIVPIAGVIFKQKRILLCFVLALTAFQISCFFTYNLRYSMAIFLVLAALVGVTSSMLIESIKGKKRKHFLYLVLLTVIVIPNCLYICKYYDLQLTIKPNQQITTAANQSVLDEVPVGKKVFSLNDPFKGEYRGFYNAYMWHNTYNVNRINSGEVSLDRYIESFDYALYEKYVYTDPVVLEYMTGAAKEQLEIIAESDSHILYKVLKDLREYNTISQEKFENPFMATVQAPYTKPFPVAADNYRITQEVENRSLETIQMRYQINWFDENNQMVDVSILVYELLPGVNSGTIEFQACPDASYGMFYISPHDDSDVYAHSYSLIGISDIETDLERQQKMYDTRELLIR